jgi:hypothetical protein
MQSLLQSQWSFFQNGAANPKIHMESNGIPKTKTILEKVKMEDYFQTLK